MTARSIAAVVLDVGETLVDETRMWTAWAKHLGVPPLTLHAVLGAVIDRGGQHHDATRILRPEVDIDAEARALDAAGMRFVAAEDLYPDALDGLRGLRAAGYRVGIAANQPASTSAVMEGLGIELDLVATSAAWGVAKPSPAFFERIATELRLPPERIAYVGDRLDNDIRPARAAGMAAVWIRRGPWAWVQAGRSEPPEAHVTVEGLANLASALAAAGYRPG